MSRGFAVPRYAEPGFAQSGFPLAVHTPPPYAPGSYKVGQCFFAPLSSTGPVTARGLNRQE